MIKRSTHQPLLLLAIIVCIGVSVLVLSRGHARRTLPNEQQRPLDPLAVLLTPLPGEGTLDNEIRELQQKVESAEDRDPLLERLGWALVAKARLSSDPGFYSLAEQAANAITNHRADDPGALLLLGHVRHAQHRFAEAEKIARALVTRREFVFDYALLGDALMEQGKLGEALEAYQKMVDLKPCLQTYSRVAHMRWLKGDLRGAIEATRFAVSAGSPREPEPTAWAYTRLAAYQLQAGNSEEAMTSSEQALQLAPDYAPALLVRGRLLLASGNDEDALRTLKKAAELSPLPDFLWTLAEALRATNNLEEAQQVEAKLTRSGAQDDGRTFALFLATRGEDTALALRLAAAELENRQDIFTYDALAWAQFADGQVAQARATMRRALAEGTQDARLFFHAGSIAEAAGENADALEFFRKAHALEQTLLPSERQALAQRSAALLSAAKTAFPQLTTNQRPY